MTNTTTPVGDEDIPPLPIHPEPHSMTWNELEKDAMRAYARAAIKQHMERQAAPAVDMAIAAALPQARTPQPQPSRSKKLAAAGFTAREKLTGAGGLVRAKFLDEDAQAQPVAEPIDFSAEFTRAKNLIVRLWNTHPSTRPMIEGATGSWFVWGTDRNATPEKG